MIAPVQQATYPSNPFCTRFVRPGALEYQFPAQGVEDVSSTTLAQIVGRLDQCRTGLIVGAHGSGKTTLLHSLGPRLRDRFAEIAELHLCASPSSRMLARLEHARQTARQVHQQHARLCRGGLLIVDGAEQLWRHDLSRLMGRVHRRGQVFLATSHTPLRRMTVVHHTHISERLVTSLTDSLLAGVSPELAEIVRSELLRQDWSTLTNVRDLWFDLYDVVQPHLTSSQYPHSRNNRDGRSLVCHHGSFCTSDGGRWSDRRGRCR